MIHGGTSVCDTHTGNVLVGESQEVVFSWWGPGPIPQGHILHEQVNTLVCQPEDEDTLLATTQCTGWIKLLAMQVSQFATVADAYSEAGE